MTITSDIPLQQKTYSFAEFLTLYGESNRYELIDGEIFDLEPTGKHKEVAGFLTTVAGFLTTKACAQIDLLGLPWFNPSKRPLAP